MTVAVQSANRAPRPSSLADVIDLVLDKGIVIDAYVRLALIGIEALTLDARIVIASVDTYLRFAEAVNRLDLRPHEAPVGLPDLVEHLRDDNGKGRIAKGAVSGGAEGAEELVTSLRGRGGEELDARQRRIPAERSAPRARRGRRVPADEAEDED